MHHSTAARDLDYARRAFAKAKAIAKKAPDARAVDGYLTSPSVGPENNRGIEWQHHDGWFLYRYYVTVKPRGQEAVRIYSPARRATLQHVITLLDCCPTVKDVQKVIPDCPHAPNNPYRVVTDAAE